MKALTVTAPETIEIKEVPLAELLPGFIRIRIEYCLICTWEKRIFTGDSPPLPFVPGHEASGVIEEIHPDTATSFRVGDSVVFKTLDHCGHCRFCYAGETNLCEGVSRKREYGGIPGSGGMAQYIDLEPGRIFKVASDLPLEIAAFAEPLACCYHSVMRADILPGDFVGISGGGIMGQLNGILAAMRGAKVLLMEPNGTKAALAREVGVHRTVDPFGESVSQAVDEFTGGKKLDCFIITTPQLSIAEEAFGYVRKSGTIIYYGSFHPKGTIPFDPNAVHYNQQVITGSYSPSTEDFFRAARLLSENLVDMKPYLNEIHPLNRAEKAFRASLNPENYRVAVKMQE